MPGEAKQWPIPRKGLSPGTKGFSGAVLLISLALLYFYHFPLSPLPQSGKAYRVGALYWSMQIPCQTAMRRGLEDEAARINRSALQGRGRPVALETFVAGEGQTGIERQVVQMRNLILSRPDLIIVQPTDNAALSSALKEANARGIPVVAYDQYIMGGDLASYVTTDNYQAGWLDGEYCAYLFRGRRELKLILVEYPHVSSTVERLNGFLDALHKYGVSFKILKTYNAVEPRGGHEAGKAILKDFPESGSVDLLFSVNDGGGLAVVEELKKAGRREIVVATVDGDPESVRNIVTGRLTKIDAAQFCGPMGTEAMRVSYQFLNGKKVPRRILIPPFPVTRETVGIYPGWMGPIPGRFRKPWSKTGEFWTGEFKIFHDPIGETNEDGAPQ